MSSKINAPLHAVMLSRSEASAVALQNLRIGGDTPARLSSAPIFSPAQTKTARGMGRFCLRNWGVG
jgi:hypothetical protein